MSELTPEQLQAAETMPLSDLIALAEKEFVAISDPEKAPDRQRDEQGRFVADPAKDEEDEEVIGSGDPAKTIYRKEIPNGDGSVDVYEADSLEDLVDKIAVGKLNANKKIQEFIAEKKQSKTKTDQEITDENYVLEQNLKTKPAETIKELAKQALAEEQEKIQRRDEAASRFLATHPDYIASQDNGNRLTKEVRNLGFNEITSDSLEKAYQSLKASGLLKLKDAEANDATEEEASATQRTAEPKVEPTTQRSSQRSSTISTRTSSRTVTPRNTAPTEDEMYKMPLDKLRELADAQLKASE